MKIHIRDFPGSPATDSDYVNIDAGARDVELEGVYNGVAINTDQGRFGIAQRDCGIEVTLDGELVWSSSRLGTPTEPETLNARCSCCELPRIGFAQDGPFCRCDDPVEESDA